MPKNAFWQGHRVSSDPRPKPSTLPTAASDTTQLKARRDSIQTAMGKQQQSAAAHADSGSRAPFTEGGEKEFRAHYKKADAATKQADNTMRDLMSAQDKLDSARTAAKKKKP